MERELTRIREKAGKEPKTRFTSIYHYVTAEENLRASYRELEGGKAPGIDGITKEEYGKDLEKNLRDLSERLARMGYRPKPVRRVYIPKPGSEKKRPLGIPCTEDKIVQRAVVRVLEQIYEKDFLDCSYGYRPGRTAHQALNELGRTIQQQKVSYIVEADIQGFFDHVNQEWLIKFLELRVGDGRLIRLIQRFLRAGVMEDGLVRESEEGTPQGGSLSPLLSNIYLHYVLDLWWERVFRRTCRGEVYFFRFADDYLACFQYRREAEQFLAMMTERLGKFHLTVEPSKTRLLAFGRFTKGDAEREGKQAETFDFLGFTHYCGQTRYGSFKVKRRTSRKKIRGKLQGWRDWLRERRCQVKAGALLKEAKAKLRGHLNYYAVTDNLPMCQAFKHQVTRLLFKWLNRRSQRKSYNWERFQSALDWVDWPSVRRVHNLDPFKEVGSGTC
jgi:RNA-directed DNA polymerase